MRVENSHQSELVSQLLYGDCFKILSIKKDWIQITSLADNYSGWIDHKQAQIISKEVAERIVNQVELVIILLHLKILKRIFYLVMA